MKNKGVHELHNASLVLEGGGMRGMFTTGVLDFFLKADLHFKSCLAVSAGAAHGCSYLSRQSGRSWQVVERYLKDPRYCSLQSLVTTGDLFGASFIYDEIPRRLLPVDNQAFIRNQVRFQPVVTNCVTGLAHYPVVRDLLAQVDWVRASGSLPGVSRMVKLGGIPYLDGGIADSIPYKQAFAEGYKKAVVVLTRCKGYQKKPRIWSRAMHLYYRDYPALVEAMKTRHLRYNRALEELWEEEAKGTVFVIAPQQPLATQLIEKDIKKLHAAYQIGQMEAERQKHALLDFLRG